MAKKNKGENNNLPKGKRASMPQADIAKVGINREALKTFRRNMGILKKQGLFNGDARSVKPTKHYKSLIRQFSDVISGELKAVFGTPSECVSKEGCKTVKRGGKTYTLINIPKGSVVRHTKQGFKLVDLFDSWGSKSINNGGANLYKQWLRQIAGDDDVKSLPKAMQDDLDRLKDVIKKYWSLGLNEDSLNPNEYRLRIPFESDVAEWYTRLVMEVGFTADTSAYGSQVQA